MDVVRPGRGGRSRVVRFDVPVAVVGGRSVTPGAWEMARREWASAWACRLVQGLPLGHKVRWSGWALASGLWAWGSGVHWDWG